MSGTKMEPKLNTREHNRCPRCQEYIEGTYEPTLRHCKECIAKNKNVCSDISKNINNNIKRCRLNKEMYEYFLKPGTSFADQFNFLTYIGYASGLPRDKDLLDLIGYCEHDFESYSGYLISLYFKDGKRCSNIKSYRNLGLSCYLSARVF